MKQEAKIKIYQILKERNKYNHSLNHVFFCCLSNFIYILQFIYIYICIYYIFVLFSVTNIGKYCLAEVEPELRGYE